MTRITEKDIVLNNKKNDVPLPKKWHESQKMMLCSHVLFTSEFSFWQNIQKLMWADWNYELAVSVTDPKISHIEGQKDLLSG